MNLLLRCFTFVVSVILLLTPGASNLAHAQIPNFEQIGLPQNSTSVPVSLGQIDLATGSMHLEVPLVSQVERNGRTFSASLTFDSTSWQYLVGLSINPPFWLQPDIEQFEPLNGWRFVTSGTPGVLDYSFNVDVCQPAMTGAIYSADDQYYFSYTEPSGTTHRFTGVATYYNIGADPVNYPCNAERTSASGYSDDGTGFFISVVNYTDAKVYAPDGTQVYPRVEDSNGNFYSTDSNGNVVNTLGLTPVTVTSDSGHKYYTVPNPPGSSAPTSTYTATIGTITVSIPSDPNYAGFSQSRQTITSISRPDGSAYIFNYDSWGTLQSITLPTGGTEQYGYSVIPVLAQADAYARQMRVPSSYTAGPSTNTQTFAAQFVAISQFTAGYQVTLQNPLEADGSGGGSVLYKYSNLGNYWNTERDFTTSNGTALRTELFTYDQTCTVHVTNHKVSVFDSNGANPLTSQTGYDYSSQANVYNCPFVENNSDNPFGPFAVARPDSISEYDYGASTPLRTTYYHWSEEDGGYASAGNAALLKTAITVYGNSDPTVCANIATGTRHLYDGGGLQPQTGDSYHDYGFANPRGNSTESDVYNTSNCQWQVKSTAGYDELGNIVSSTDALPQHLTTFVYDPSSVYAFPLSSRNALGQITHFNYDPQTGLLNNVQDPNSQTTAYTYENLRRPSTISYPDMGSTSITYLAPNTTTTKQAITSTSSLITRTVVDGFGRTAMSTIDSDQAGADQVSYSYNYNGRVQSVSNPYRGASPPVGQSTSYVYDALGRKTKQIQQDQNALLWTFSQNTTDYFDELNVHWRHTSDGLGRLTAVNELGTSAAPLNLTTNYAYDALNDLTAVMQNGAGSETPRTREFAYDSLGRLTAANNPETASNSSPASLSCVPGGPWTTCYTYDLNSNLATKTDNRNVTITYGYDSLSRLISKVYSGQGAGSAIAATTNSSCYQYDISPTAATGGNFIGRLTVAWTQAGMCPLNAPPSGYQTLRSILQYDPMGRAKIEVQCSLKTCTTGPPTVNTSYNLLGERSTYDNGFGTLTITNSYNQANRLSQITSNINDQTHPQQLYNVLDADFSPAGLVNHNMLGINISVIPTYDSRLRTSTLSAVKQ